LAAHAGEIAIPDVHGKAPCHIQAEHRFEHIEDVDHKAHQKQQDEEKNITLLKISRW